MLTVQLLLYDRSHALTSAVRRLLERYNTSTEEFILDVLPYSSDVPLSEVISKNQIDAIVSPGNGFGFMDGGFDAALSGFYDPLLTGKQPGTLTRVVQKELYKRARGYTPESTVNVFNISKLDPLSNYELPQLIHAPTMAIPEVIPQSSPVVFNTMWNILTAINNVNSNENEDPISKVLITGLGTGTGGVSYESCAIQMVGAYGTFLNLDGSGVPPTGLTWQKAEEVYNGIKRTYT